MIPSSPIRKVFEGVADRRQMYRLFDRHVGHPFRSADAGDLHTGEWFEIAEADYDHMLDLLPPLWMRGDMFALAEYLIGSVTSIFFALSIRGRMRWFHGYCDLADRGSPDRMRRAILEREALPGRGMTRAECLEHIWSETHERYRGHAGADWPVEARGRRFVVVYGQGGGARTRLLEELTIQEIAAKLPGRPLAVTDAAAA